MNVSLKSTLTAGAALALLMAANCPRAAAATLNYTFDETGWKNTAGTAENFFGSFSGTPETNGLLQVADLSSFSATMTETNATGETKTIATFGATSAVTGLAAFVYNTGTGAFNLAASDAAGDLVCLGSTIAAGDCGPVGPPPAPKPGTPPPPPLEGLFSSAVNGTLSAPSFTVPTVTDIDKIAPVPAPAPVPEPASVALSGGGFLMLATLLRRLAKHRGRQG